MKFWPSLKKEKVWPQEGDTYEFYDPEDIENLTCVRILKGEYKGLLYHYGKVEVVEIEDPPKIKFDYSIVDEAGFDLEKLHSDTNFITLLGDILVSIFDKNIIDDKKELDESPRINNIEESGL